MKIVIGGLNHETSTFTPVQTTWASYHERFFLRGEAIIQTLRGTNTPIGGFIAGAEAHGFEAIPTLYAEPHPSGPTPRSIFDAILEELLERITAAGHIDGILLDLHGAMVAGNVDEADGLPDADGFILAAVRNLVGPDVPLVVQLDIHANVSPQMVAMADVLIGRETFSEIDMADRGRECVDVLSRMLNAGLRPAMALYQLPMIWGKNQVTAQPPMREAIAALHRIEAQSNVVCGSIAVGYPLADVASMGSTVYIVTDENQARAQQLADELGKWIVDRCPDWYGELPTTREALAQSYTGAQYPLVFADTHDNTGGGAPGDSTGMLKTFVEAKLVDACVLYIVDPQSVAQCRQAGIGATLTLDVGGKSSLLQGEPVSMRVEVMALSDGRFQYAGPMYAGLEGNMGPSAYIRHEDIHVVLTSVGEQPYDTAFAQSLGLDPHQMRYIGLKSTAHFRAGFEAWAGQIYVVSEPGVHNPTNLTFQRLGRNVYPIDSSGKIGYGIE